jgi:hypothetical protein
MPIFTPITVRRALFGWTSWTIGMGGVLFLTRYWYNKNPRRMLKNLPGDKVDPELFPKKFN